MLIHARTDTKWFHDWVYGKSDLRFIRGRLHFNGSKWNAPFPSLVAVYTPEKKCKDCEYNNVQNFYCGHCIRNKYLQFDFFKRF